MLLHNFYFLFVKTLTFNFALGFGKDKINGQYQRAMKQVDLPMVEHKVTIVGDFTFGVE